MALTLAAAVGVLVAFPGCSVRKIAINKLGDALAHSGTSFASDDDPELIKAAAPFSLKLMESLLAESPVHSGLLLAACSGFTQYSYAFVHQESDELEEKDLTASRVLKERARRLYIRARDYGLRGLELKHPGFSAAMRKDPIPVLRSAKRDEVAWLYWTAAAWGAVISLSKDNPEIIADQPLMEAMMDRALELDEAFGDGAIHSFLISYESARQNGVGSPESRIRKHFDRAITLSGGKMAGPLVTFAETVSVKNQNADEFKSLLNQSLKVDVASRPQWRLVNLVMQRRARWLLSRTEDLFLPADPVAETKK